MYQQVDENHIVLEYKKNDRKQEMILKSLENKNKRIKNN